MKKILTILSLSLVLTAFSQPTVPTAGDDNSSSDGSSGGGGGSSVSRIPTSLPFLSSKAALRTYAGESARSAHVEFKSPGMQYGAAWGTGWEGPKGLQFISEELNELNVDIPMVNVADTVKAEAKVNNSDGEPLFTATSWRTPEMGKAAYILPRFFFGLQIADLIPIKMDKSVNWAQVKYLAEDGQTLVTVDVEVRNGKVYYPSKFAGKSMLVVYDDKGNAFVFDRKGQRVPTERVQWSGADSYFQGMYSYENPKTIDFQAWSWNGQGENPAFEVTMSEYRKVEFWTYSNEGAEAIGYNVRRQGQTEWTFYPVQARGERRPIALEPGVSYVVPVWNSDEFKEHDPYIYGDGGPVEVPGKG